MWGDVPSLLGPSHRVIQYDRRSFGLSSQPPLADTRRHTLDAIALLETLRAAPATLVGWSIGGVIALDLAVVRPDLVRSVIVLDAPLHAKTHPSLRLLRAIAAVQFRRRTSGAQGAAESFLRWALSRSDGQNDLDRVPHAWRTAMLSNASSIVREIDAGTDERELGPEAIARLDRPVVWLSGESSDSAIRSAANRFARRYLATRLREVEATGHLIQRDRPDAIADAVAFLGE